MNSNTDQRLDSLNKAFIKFFVTSLVSTVIILFAGFLVWLVLHGTFAVLTFWVSVKVAAVAIFLVTSAVNLNNFNKSFSEDFDNMVKTGLDKHK